MKWLKWFKANSGEEERYQMFRARFLHEQQRQREIAAEQGQRDHEDAMEAAYGGHGQG